MNTNLFKKVVRSEKGISALEYALIAALIALAIITGAQFLGDTMDAEFNESATELEAAD